MKDQFLSLGRGRSVYETNSALASTPSPTLAIEEVRYFYYFEDLTEYFSNVIYCGVGGRHTTKNSNSYEFIQENLDMKRNITFNSQIKQTGKYKGQCSYCGSSNKRQNGTKLWDEFANAKNKTHDGGAKEAPFDTKSCWKRRPKNDLR